MELHIRFNKLGPKVLIMTALVLSSGAGIGWLLSHHHHSNIPSAISRQVSFKTVSAPSALVKGDSYQYLEANKALFFTINFQGLELGVTEQTAPDNLISGSGVYFQSLGLHPVAQFQTKAGPVAILNFYKTGSLDKAGSSGLLVAGKTMVIVNLADTSKTLTNDQWKQLFDSLQLDK